VEVGAAYVESVGAILFIPADMIQLISALLLHYRHKKISKTDEYINPISWPLPLRPSVSEDSDTPLWGASALLLNYRHKKQVKLMSTLIR